MFKPLDIASFNSKRILMPVQKSFVYFSIIAALLLNFLPPRSWPLMPDWVALVLCYWAMRQPNLVGMGVAFLCGLLMDVADGNYLGVHAIAYVTLTYIAHFFTNRLLWFPLWQQSLQVLPMLLFTKFIQIVLGALVSAQFPGPWIFVGPIIAALLWSPLSVILLTPQYRSVIEDENRTL